MKLPRRQFLHLAAAAATLPALSRLACAQSYPTRPIRLIVPYAQGGLDASSEQGSRLRDVSVRESDDAPSNRVCGTRLRGHIP